MKRLRYLALVLAATSLVGCGSGSIDDNVEVPSSSRSEQSLGSPVPPVSSTPASTAGGVASSSVSSSLDLNQASSAASENPPPALSNNEPSSALSSSSSITGGQQANASVSSLVSSNPGAAPTSSAASSSPVEEAESSSLISSVSSSSVSRSTASISSVSSIHVGDPIEGERLYKSSEQQCAQCHGDDGQDPTARVINPSLASFQHSNDSQALPLIDYLVKWMPVANPSLCDSVCATDIAAFIETWQLPPAVASFSGLAHHFDFNEGAGQIAADTSDASLQGDIQGADWSEGRFGSALEFNAGDSMVDLGDLNVESSQITLSAWIKPSSLRVDLDSRIISKATGNYRNEHTWMLSLKHQDGHYRLRFRLRTNVLETRELLATQGEVQEDVWQHIAATYDGTTMKLWLDGEEVGSASDLVGEVAISPNVSVAVGNNPGGGKGFYGLIDEVKVFDVALSETQLQEDMAGTLTHSSNATSSASSSTASTTSASSAGSPPPSSSSSLASSSVIPTPIERLEFSPKYSCDNAQSRGLSQNFSRRLTKAELTNSLAVLFGDTLMADADIELKSLPSENYGFHPEDFNITLTPTHLDTINTVAVKLANNAIADMAFITRYTSDSCADLSSLSCVDELLDNFGSRALRRPILATEKQRYLDAMSSDAEVSAATIIHALLLSPEFNLIVETGIPQGDGRYRLTPYEIAARVSFRTTASSPDDALWEAAQNNQLSTLAQIKTQVERLLASDRGKQYVRGFFHAWLEIDEEADVGVSDAYRRGLDVNALYTSALDDFNRFVDYIVWDKQGSIEDLLLDKSVFPSTDELASVYGTTTSNNRLNAQTNHRGILLRAATLIGGGNHTPIIQRGVMVRRKLLCDPLPSPNQDIVNARDDSAGPDELDPLLNSNRQVISNLTQGIICMACHTKINPLGFVLEEFDSLGRIQREEYIFDNDDQLATSYTIDPAAYLPDIEVRGTNYLPDSTGLASALAYGSKLKSCFATQLFRYQHLDQESANDHCSLSDRETVIGINNGRILDALIENVANEDIFWRGK